MITPPACNIDLACKLLSEVQCSPSRRRQCLPARRSGLGQESGDAEPFSRWLPGSSPHWHRRPSTRRESCVRGEVAQLESTKVRGTEPLSSGRQKPPQLVVLNVGRWVLPSARCTSAERIQARRAAEARGFLFFASKSVDLLPFFKSVNSCNRSHQLAQANRAKVLPSSSPTAYCEESCALLLGRLLERL